MTKILSKIQEAPNYVCGAHFLFLRRCALNLINLMFMFDSPFIQLGERRKILTRRIKIHGDGICFVHRSVSLFIPHPIAQRHTLHIVCRKGKAFDLVQGHKVHMGPSGPIHTSYFSALHFTRRNMQKYAQNKMRQTLFLPVLGICRKMGVNLPRYGHDGYGWMQNFLLIPNISTNYHFYVVKVGLLDDFQRPRKITTKEVNYISLQKMSLASPKKRRSLLTLDQSNACARGHVTSSSPTALPKKIKKANMAAFWNQIAKIFAILLAAKPRYKKPFLTLIWRRGTLLAC